MKQPVNFRLSKETQALLAQFAMEHHLSKTEVLEDAIKAYVRAGKETGKKKKPHPLRKFVGAFTREETDAMLEAYHLRGGSRPIPKW